MSIIRGRMPQSAFITVYGPDGVGKTSFAAGAPNVLFLDAEGGTLHMDVAREPISSYRDLDNALNAMASDAPEYAEFKSVAFDSLDWLVPKVYEYVCATVKHEKGHTVDSIEGFGFGKGYVHAREVWQRLIGKCKLIRAKGINVILLAHAQVFSVDSPDTQNAYKQFDLKLPRTPNNDIAALFREACDTVAFLSYKRLTLKDDPRAIDGGRVLRTQHAPGWAAKNRFGLPEEISLPELERDKNGGVLPRQEMLLWAAYADAVAKSQKNGPSIEALLKMAAQITKTETRAKAIAAIQADADQPAKLHKHMERLKAILSKGTDVTTPTTNEEI